MPWQVLSRSYKNMRTETSMLGIWYWPILASNGWHWLSLSLLLPQRPQHQKLLHQLPIGRPIKTLTHTTRHDGRHFLAAIKTGYVTVVPS